MEPDAACVGLLKLAEPGLEVLCRVGDILHDVRGAPQVGDAGLLFELQHLEGFLKGADSVVHTEEDVAVAVGASLKGSGVQKGAPDAQEFEECHDEEGVLFYGSIAIAVAIA